MWHRHHWIHVNNYFCRDAQIKMNHYSPPVWFFPPQTPLKVTQRLLLQFHLLSLLTFMISAKVCTFLQLQVLNYTPLLLAEGDRKSASSPGSCSSQMLQWQAVIGWQIKENGFPWVGK